MSAISINLDAAALTPIVERVVVEVLAKFDAIRQPMGDKLAYSEQEAARLLSLESHQLRDERLRGRIRASQIVGRRIRYTREDLLSYLSGRRFSPS